MQNRSVNYYLLLALLALISLNACNTTKYLKDDEYLLRGNTVNFKKSAKSIKNKPALKYELGELYRQKSNRKFFGVPREWFFYKTSDPDDTTKFDKWIRRVIAERPAIYNDTLREDTESALKFFMRKKGYFNVDVYSDKRIKNKKIYVDYYIEPAKQFTIDSINFFSPDPKINSILDEISPQSFFKRNAPLESNTIDKEKERITSYLKNNGYAYFYPYYISKLEVDTTLKPQKANLYLEVDLPPIDSSHKVYRIGDIKIFTDYSPLIDISELYDTTINEFNFYNPEPIFEVKPKVITDAIYLKKGDLYSQNQYDRTYQNLLELGVYKFVRIRQQIDSLNSNLINFQIELTTAKRMELSLNFEWNYTNRSSSSITPNLFGITLSPALSHKNFLGGAEFSITNLSAGLEFNYPPPRGSNAPGSSNNRLWNTVDFGIQTELDVPKFLDYLKFWKLSDKLRFGKKVKPLDQRFYTFLKEDAVSRFTAGYNYILILDLYRYNLFNASFGYSARKSNTRRYLINHIGVDYLEPFIQDEFQEILTANPFLEGSFENQLFVSLLFRDFNYTFNSRPKSNGESNYFSFNIETAGSEIWAINKLTNAVNNSNDIFRIGSTEFSQYISLEGDLRYYKQITPERGLATRIYMGIARPFGFSDQVPFVKQFAVGGPNSIRGWVERGLGPGGFVDTLAHDPNNRFRLDSDSRLRLYQTGDFKLEFNAEYRFNLYWLLDAAIFLDAGNIWTIKPDEDRCGSQFLFRSKTVSGCEEEGIVNDPFYRQIALGTGVGLRLDLTYFILRLDMGTRLRYPFPLRIPRPENVRESYYWTDFKGWGINDVNFNLGFGYPF